MLMKLRARDDVSEHEALILQGSISKIRKAATDEVVVRAGVELNECNLLVQGLGLALPASLQVGKAGP